jgi:hypothetical protein
MAMMMRRLPTTPRRKVKLQRKNENKEINDDHKQKELIISFCIVPIYRGRAIRSQKVLSRPSANSLAVGRKQKGSFLIIFTIKTPL